jgi:hypothetical protein
MTSFTVTGILILSVGSSLGLDQSSLRPVGAVILRRWWEIAGRMCQ